MIGFINVYKPKDVSSALVVGKFKKKVKCKCGHMGTLDPLASGVLPIGLNQANRMFDFLLDKTKTYVATFDFAFQTPSLDLETEKIKIADYIPTVEEVKGILPCFIGNISQVPPDYSAKMIDGKRCYKLARKGVQISLPAKNVEILNIEMLEQVSESAFSFKIDCKGGTYIRSLARDFGEKFGCPATMTSLERTGAGIFRKENSIEIDKFLECEDIEKYIIKADEVVNFEKFVLSEEKATRLLNGLYDDFSMPNGLYRVYSETEFWGVGEMTDGKLKMKAYIRDI